MELCSMLCAQCCPSLDGTGVWGRMDTCIRMAESLHCSPETITTLLISYSPIQNKKFCFVLFFLKNKKRSSLKMWLNCWSSVQSLSRVRLFATPGVHSNSCPSSQWCHPAISSSVVPFSYCPQSLPASGSFPMSQLFAWGGQSTRVSGLASVLPMNTQDWSPLGWTGWISLQSKGLSRVFSNTTVQKHQFFGAQPSSQSNSRIHTWPQEKP